jgi:hypothetical protein
MDLRPKCKIQNYRSLGIIGDYVRNLSLVLYFNPGSLDSYTFVYSSFVKNWSYMIKIDKLYWT